MKRTLLIALTFCLSTHAQVLKEFKVSAENFSSELELIVDQLSKDKEISYKRAEDLLNAASVINEDVKVIPRPNALFLIKSEIYKGLLGSSLLPKDKGVLVNAAFLSGIEKKLDENRKNYTPFSSWVMLSILEEISPYRRDGFLDKYLDLKSSDVKERAKALKLKKLVGYTSPWLAKFNNATAEEFNNLSTDIAENLLILIAKKTYYFKQFASSLSNGTTEQLFEIPTISPDKTKSDSLPEADLEQEKTKAKSEGEKAMDVLEKPSFDSASEAIDGLMKKESKNEAPEGWKPE